MTREPPVMDSGRPRIGQADSLIAAAPDMLAALKTLVDWYGERVGANDALLPIERQSEEIAAAMRAIAKAEGGA